MKKEEQKKWNPNWIELVDAEPGREPEDHISPRKPKTDPWDIVGDLNDRLNGNYANLGDGIFEVRYKQPEVEHIKAAMEEHLKLSK